MRLTFLGTGTSTGVPQIGCDCPTCTSSDKRDKRMRASAILSFDDGRNLLLDCGPDFRSQILAQGSPPLDAVLLTHSHYDHIGGIDDLRPYCNGEDFPVYCKADVAQDLRQRNPWSFKADPYPGVPTFEIHEVDPDTPFYIGDTEIIPLLVWHARLPILGYRIGPFAYITDCKTMPESTLEKLKGVDTLVINALRYEDHISHMTVPEALQIVNQVAPRQTYFTHICHRMGRHADNSFPPGVQLAFDGLQIHIDN